MRKVAITGMGMITALGNDVDTTWMNMLQGKSGVKTIKNFDTSDLETKIAAQVNNDFEKRANEIIPKRQRKKMTRSTRMLLVAADEAVEDSQIDFSHIEDRTKAAAILGIVSAGYNDEERKESDSNMIVKSMANAPSSWLSIKYGLEGPSFSVSTACASSAYAINLACNMIRSGIIDIALVGGVDTHIESEYIRGFNQIIAMSVLNDSPETASRPFSKSRDGFVMGEGAGVLVIEELEHAVARNAHIYAEIVGGAISSEASDITAPMEGGIGMAKTMRMALSDAGVKSDEVDYINAHGTSTYLNDKCETYAIKNVFGEHSKDILVSSSKSMLGHTIAAGGAVEGIITVKSICEGEVTPTINYIEADEELDLDYVPNKSRKKEIKVALSNSFGFGGHNAAIVFRKIKYPQNEV